MKHGTGFVDVSVPYQGFKLSLHLARIEDVGEFTLFCLRAFGDGLSLSDLSQVTAIDRMTIQKNLDFLVKREFVDEKHKISSYGRAILDLHAKINDFNSTNKVVFLESVVRERTKKWREREELTIYPSRVIVEENMNSQDLEQLYNAHKDTDQIIDLLGDTEGFKGVVEELSVRLEPQTTILFLVLRVNPKALTPAKNKAGKYVRAISGEQECFIEIETLYKKL